MFHISEFGTFVVVAIWERTRAIFDRENIVDVWRGKVKMKIIKILFFFTEKKRRASVQSGRVTVTEWRETIPTCFWRRH